MSNKEVPNRWFPGWRATPRPQEQDPADMGTAFGLDLSLNVLHAEQAPAPAERTPTWVSRLTMRRKSA